MERESSRVAGLCLTEISIIRDMQQRIYSLVYSNHRQQASVIHTCEHLVRQTFGVPTFGKTIVGQLVNIKYMPQINIRLNND